MVGAAKLLEGIHVAAESDAIQTAQQFLTTLFDEQDLVLYRPIETWTEGGRKRSRVIYRHTLYRACMPVLILTATQRLLEVSVSERANVFFGVCPRFGKDGRFDLAWQIRTVRCLWSDIDDTAVEEALERCDKGRLPPPSLAINSGSGTHLYWLLGDPHRIDDVGEPAAVETEWLETPNRRRTPRKYVMEGGERVYLDQQRYVSRLSEKAQRVQDVLSGIAQAISGDHTTDLARLLRVPGTLNRKDERNGRAPLPTALVVYEPGRRYQFTEFEKFACPAPETKRQRQITVMPLPKHRSLTVPKADKLAELMAACAIAEPGSRSEADFALCCFAIRQGMTRDELWGQVQETGKFVEQGEWYFRLTWDNAEYDVRASTYEKLQKRSANGKPTLRTGRTPSDGLTGGPAESDGGNSSDDGRPTIHIDPRTTPVGTTMGEISGRLLASGDCYTRAGQLVVIRHDAISPILSAKELTGLLNHYVEFYFIKDEEGEYRPLPTSYANTWLNHPGEQTRFPAIRMFTHNPVYTEDWRLVTPGYDGESSIYYCGPPVEPREGTERLDALLRDFCFKAPGDRTNYVGLLLTVLLMPRFIGSKPAALLNGNQPQLGKSILAQIIAVLRDGHVVETVTYNPNDEEFEKRLGAIVRRGATTIIVDNAKGHGRNPRIESACLERSITDPILSFRLLGFSLDIRAENSHMFCLTANVPDVSRDLITRSVVINLYHEGNPTRRQFAIADPEGYAQEHRVEILGELIGMVERWNASGRPLADVDSRFNKRGWAHTIGGILAANGEPDFLANAEEAATQLDETRREFSELVAVLAEHPQGTWTGGKLAKLAGRHDLLQHELGTSSERSKATRMGVLAGRYVAERFPLAAGGEAVFHRFDDRKGHVYRVEVREVPYVGPVAERLPNVAEAPGSAP